MGEKEEVKFQLAFLPHLAKAEEGEIYRCFLLNTSARSYLYEVHAQTMRRGLDEQKGRLEAGAFFQLHPLSKDDLNDRPVYRFCFWEILEGGTGPSLFCELSLRPKSFFAKRQYHEILGQDVHLYTLMLQGKKGEGESLSDYVHRKGGTSSSATWRNPKVEVHSPEALASFPREIDLHIEALVSDSKGMDAAQILRIQLRAFEKYLEKAIRLGVDRVLIIHGKGEGVLRRHIHQVLSENPYVRRFEKIHPTLGTGVTEVFF